MIEGSESVPLTLWIRIQIQEAQKHTDPTLTKMPILNPPPPSTGNYY
jgi:hypothetical protein